MTETVGRPLRRRQNLEACVAALLVVVGVVSCYLRVPGEHLDIVWAEDGEIFLRENLDDGFWSTLFRGYAGYQHLAPRLLAGAAIPMAPLDVYPLVVFALCAAVTGLVGAAVFWLSRDVVEWMPARIALGAITFVLPLSMQEVIGNLADLHSYFMWLAPWLLFHRPRSWRSASFWGGVAFLTVMTEVQAVIFLAVLPFVMRRRNPHFWPIAAGFLIGSAVQLATVFTVERGSASQWFGLPSLIQGYLINTVLPLLVVSPDAVRGHLERWGLLLPTGILAVFIVAAIVVLIWGTGTQRLLVLVLLSASFAIYAGGVTVDGNEGFFYSDGGMPMWDRAVNIRYGVSSGMLLVASVPLAASVLVARSRSMPARARMLGLVAWVSVCGLILVLAVASTRAVSTRGWVEANWSYSIQTARDDCRADSPLERKRIPIAPLRHIELTCSELAP